MQLQYKVYLYKRLCSMGHIQCLWENHQYWNHWSIHLEKALTCQAKAQA